MNYIVRKRGVTLIWRETRSEVQKASLYTDCAVSANETDYKIVFTFKIKKP